MHRAAASLLAVVLLTSSLVSHPQSVFAQDIAPDIAVPNGRFYTQASGQNDGGRTGYAVVDDSKAPFWREFQRLGGPQVVGFPISRRFTYNGFETQAFQKLVFQWKPAENRVDFLNIFDLLSDAKKDDWLVTVRQVPNKGTFNEQGRSWDDIVRSRLALLDENPAIKAAFMGVRGDPIAMNGLPTAKIADYPTVQVLRAQRVVFQYWKVDVPWAAARTVTVANGGDVAKEAGLYPQEATRPMTLVEATGASTPAGSTNPPAANPPAAAGQNPPANPAPANPAPGTAPVAPGTTPPLTLAPGQPLRIETGAPTAPPKPGVMTSLPVKVMDSTGKPVQGALILILVHYPLKGDDTTYATDGFFFSRGRTDGAGQINAEFMIDPKVPSGLGISLEVSAIYPPTAGKVVVPMTVP